MFAVQYIPPLLCFSYAAPYIVLIQPELALRELCSLYVECGVITGLRCTPIPVTDSLLL
jgi:hypothetical protein